MLNQLQTIFRNIFDDQSLIITNETTAKEIKMWDSLTHLQLINEIESHFKIKISFNEVMMINSVGDIISIIEKKMN